MKTPGLLDDPMNLAAVTKIHRNSACVAFVGLPSMTSCGGYSMTKVADGCLSLPCDNGADSNDKRLRRCLTLQYGVLGATGVAFHSPTG